MLRRHKSAWSAPEALNTSPICRAAVGGAHCFVVPSISRKGLCRSLPVRNIPSSAAPQSATMGVSCHVCMGGGERPSRAPPPLFQPHCDESCSGGVGSLMNKLSHFCCQSTPYAPSPSLSQQRMLGKEARVRRCELWEQTAAKKNTKLTWDHVTFSLASSGDQQTSGTKQMAARFKTRPLRHGTPWSSPAHDLTGQQEDDPGPESGSDP